MEKIRSQGRTGEEMVVIQDSLAGWHSEKIHKGADLKQTRYDLVTRRKQTMYKEVKTGNSKLSKAQQTMKKRKKGHWKEERVNPIGWW